MERYQAWRKIRDTVTADTFYKDAKASILEKELRLSTPSSIQGKFSFTPFTEVEKAAQELAELDLTLEKERLLTSQKQKEYSTRWALAYERNADLDALLQQFSRYHALSEVKVGEDVAKRSTYLRETREEEVKLRKLIKESQALERIKGSLDARGDLCETYKEYLKSVLGPYNRWVNEVKGGHGQGQPFDKIQDLIERYQELKEIREKKARRVRDNLTQVVKVVKKEAEETVNFTHAEESYRGYIQKHVDHTEHLKLTVGGLNEGVIQIKKVIQDEIMKAERPKTNIYTVYCNLAKEMGQEIKLEENDVQGQLGFIQKYLGEMKKISFRVREALKAGSEVPLRSHLKDIERTSDRSSV